MTSKKSSSLSTLFVLFTSLVTAPFSYAACGKELNEGIQKILDIDREKYNIPGVEVSIICPGESAPRDFVSGTTTFEGSIPVKPEHLFQIGDETKSFIAAILLQLEAEGRLSIEDTIGQYLPELPLAWNGIKIKHLLNHTSGLFNYTEMDDFIFSDFNKQWTPDELINQVRNKTPYFEPGSGWYYSNTNYVLAGMLIHALTGRTVETEMNQRLLVPLNLLNTHYLPSAYSQDIMQHMAHGYRNIPGVPFQDVTGFNMSWYDAAGAIVSTSHDTAIWFKKLLKTNEVLPEKQRKELMTLVDIEEGQSIPNTSEKIGYGLGIEHIRDEFAGDLWMHGGMTLGYLSNMLFLECNDVVFSIVINYLDENIDGGEALLMDLISFIQKADPSTKCNTTTGFNKSLLLKPRMSLF